ncbi:MAG: VTT domain-containing protein [Edaphobacter sp.]|uniref:VTT domain-containing protein n=1 Tax=Edaphobacter sp. TaxID=1934404 RepID=UPI00239D04AB|nr:VTT domain-containing protein [Edaphobacter sp.]MDE1175283.1 VTT domain-containing protein [Edaphobacter sp.]
MMGSPQLTYPWILIVVFARQLCLPLPAPLILIAAGAIAVEGRLDIAPIVIASVLGCLAGDGVWFWLGRRWGSRVVRIVCKLSSDPRRSSKRAHKIFERWGLRMLAIAKFIPVMDGITPPLAGAEGATVTQFVLFDGLGALLWTTMYVLIGVIFHDQLDVAVTAAQHFGKLVGLFIGLPLLLYIGWRGALIVRMMSYLRTHRLSAAALDKKMRSGERLAIIDLLEFEDIDGDMAGIPGAARIDPARMRATPKVDLPDDLSVVVYCSSRKQIVSARVVVAMRRKGARRVWILDGGLKAWRDAGFPVSHDLYTTQELAKNLGIHIPEPVSAHRRRHGRHHEEHAEQVTEQLPG